MSTEQQNASSSSYRCTYDAFLSFRGADTRKGFADHLYSALELAGIHTFRDDDEIEGGANIEQELQTAIQESRVSVIVFSTDYASSTWCLNELAIIMERTKTDGHKVVPVFYDVEPSDVRKQTGSFADSFTRHEERFKDKMDKVEEWRRALREVTDLGGMVLGERYESQFIQDIVEAVGNKLDYMNMWKRRLRVDPYVIGRDYYVESLNTWLEDGSNDVGVAVIHGMGGIGKTTIAKIAYNQNFSKFQASSFLSDIRETSKQANGFVHLQRNLLSDIQKRKVNNIYSHDEGIIKIKRAVRCKRVLIVLDDVENLEQFNVILGMRDWLHPGSKIIITTRHEHLLRAEVCVRFKVEGLPEHQSLKLFSWHAFGQPHPQEGYMELSRPVVEHCGGVPLALQVLGSSLFGKTVDVWKNALHNLDVITEGKIQKILGISFHSLQDHDKRLFLHIACFFVGKDKDFTTTILDECDFATEVGLQHLVDRCLVEINVHNKLIVHQLLQDMGRAIIHEESPEDPGKRTRLWHKDAFNVLTKLTHYKKKAFLRHIFCRSDQGCLILSSVIGNRWRDWKCRVKQRWYDAYLTDEQRLSFTPPQVTTDQWKTLVKYWGLPNIKEYSEANKANRAHGGAPHRTGRTSFAQLKHEMREKGEKTDQLSMFIKTRTKKTKNDDRDLFDEESGQIINQFNQCLEEREEHEQDEDYREEVFTRVMGPDAYGRVRMYRTGITPSQVFCQSSRSSNVNEDTIREEVERQYKTKIDDLKAKHESEIEDLRSKYSEVSSKLHLVTTHIGFHVNTSPSGSGQAPNTSSHLQETYGSNEQQPQLDPEP
nr:TMV resistance protein N-like [Malus domestica]